MTYYLFDIKKRPISLFRTLESFGSGKTGIRTLGPGKLVNGFRDRPDRPLRHLSLKNRILQRFLLKNSSVFGLQRYKLFLICKDFFIFCLKIFGSSITFLQLALLFQWRPRLTPCPAGRDLVDLAESADSRIALPPQAEQFIRFIDFARRNAEQEN